VKYEGVRSELRARRTGPLSVTGRGFMFSISPDPGELALL